MSRPLPTISIVTPSYNQGQFIRQTIESVLSQSYPAAEYFINDGGSTDGTVTILKQFTDRIVWQSKKDHGQTDAINRGMRACGSDIVAYINSDDYYLPDAFSQVAEAFGQNPELTWLVGDAVIVDEQGQEIQALVRLYKRCLRAIYSHPLLLIVNPLPQPAIFIRRAALAKIGYFDETLHYTMDYDCWIRLQHEFGRPHFLRTPLAAFRIHGDSKGGRLYQEQFAEELRVAKKFTRNPLLLYLHGLHNRCILWAYAILKKN